MTTYRVNYTVEHIGHFGPDLTTRVSHHVLLVDAPSRMHAYAAAFDYLSRTGIAISTKLYNAYKATTGYFGISDEEAAQRRLLNRLDFTDADLDVLRSLGVPVEEIESSNEITDIAVHSIDLRECTVIAATAAPLSLP